MTKPGIIRRVVQILRKMMRLSWADRFLLLEAVVLLGLAAPAIRRLPFPKVVRMASTRLREPHRTGPVAQALIERVRWAVEVGAGRARWRAVCFEQGLAAQIMLRRRGVDSTLYYGIAPDKKKEGLSAHVWVRVGEVDVVGADNAADYATVGVFPSLQGRAEMPLRPLLDDDLPPAPPEFVLAAACIAWPPSAARNARVRKAASAPIDWPLFLKMVQRHRIAGLAHDALTAAEVDAEPEIAAQLRDEAREVLQGELSLAAEAMRLQTSLLAQDIPVLVLKGVAIALSAFGRLGLRYNHDIDLLVPAPQIHKAAAILGDAGYRRIAPAADAGPREVLAWTGAHKDMVFEHRETGAIVELHWRLLDNRSLLSGRHAEAPPRLVPFVGGRAFRTLPEDLQFVYLCLHGAEHAWSRLKWLADVGALLARLDVTAVERLYRLAAAQGVGRAAAQAILISAELLDTPLPDSVRAAAKEDVRVRWLEKIAYRSMVGPGDGAELEDLPFATTLKNFSHYLLADGWRYWLREAKYDLRDTSETPLPPILRGLGPVIRPMLWLWRKGSMQLRGLVSGPARP